MDDEFKQIEEVTLRTAGDTLDFGSSGDSYGMQFEEEVSPSCASSAGKIEILGDYQLEDVIGEGSSGIVYRAKHVETQQEVAIKLFRKELVPDAIALKRFHREMEVLTKLSHPNIVAVSSFGTSSSGAPYMVMELIRGRSVKNTLDGKNVFEPRATATIIKEVCRGLSYAHEESIVHRDITPANILVGNNNIAKLVDFGNAKGIEFTGDTVTQFGTLVGTPSYMSPEQCLGEMYDARSDVYSLGCVMFEMLTGVKAFSSANPVEIIAKHISDDRRSIETTLATSALPSHMQSIILKCLARKPSERFRNIAELEHDLSAFLLNRKLAYSGASNSKLRLYAFIFALLIALLVVGQQYVNFTSVGKPETNQASVPYTKPTTSSVVESPAPIEIRSRFTGKIIFTDNSGDLKTALLHASKQRVSLAGGELQSAKLAGIKLDTLDLRGADLRSADFSQAALRNVDLRGADLSYAHLNGVTITKSDLRGADLTHVFMRQSELHSSNLSKAKLHYASLEQMYALYTIFQEADLTGAFMVQADLKHANCNGANFTGAHLGQAQFSNADCRKAQFRSAQISHMTLSNARLNFANFHHAMGYNVEIDGADFTGADLGDFKIEDNRRMSTPW